MQYYVLDLRQRKRVAVYPNRKQAVKGLDRWAMDFGPTRPFTYCLDDDKQPVLFLYVK